MKASIRRPCPVCASLEGSHERTLNGIALVRCTSCEMVFADVAGGEIEEANARIFAADSPHASNYSWNQTDLDASWFALLAQRYTKALGRGVVLDIGCGNGRLLSYFKSLGWRCVGLDPSPWSSTFAAQEGFNLLQGFPEEFPEHAENFDLVVSTSTLEHVADPEAHLRSMVSFMRPGGRVYLCGIPNYGSWAVRMGRSSFFANKPPMHVNYFTPATLGKLIARIAESFWIRTYGVPEIHRVLYLRRKKRRSHPPRPANTPTHRGRSSTLKRALSRVAVRGYYWAGAPLNLGDKLELEIRRSASLAHL